MQRRARKLTVSLLKECIKSQTQVWFMITSFFPTPNWFKPDGTLIHIDFNGKDVDTTIDDWLVQSDVEYPKGSRRSLYYLGGIYQIDGYIHDTENGQPGLQIFPSQDLKPGDEYVTFDGYPLVVMI